LPIVELALIRMPIVVVGVRARRFDVFCQSTGTVPENVPPPTQTPFIAMHPEPRSMPPANVEVEVFETIRLGSVVEPSAPMVPVNVPLNVPEILAPFHNPPVIVGLPMVTFERLSILFDCDATVNTPDG